MNKCVEAVGMCVCMGVCTYTHTTVESGVAGRGSSDGLGKGPRYVFMRYRGIWDVIVKGMEMGGLAR